MVKKFLVPAIVCSGLVVSAKVGVFSSAKNIGNTPLKGKAKFDGKKQEYLVTGSGANVWAKTDAFEYVYRQISGDATLTADIHFIGQGVEQHRKGTLMFRQTLDADSAYADAALHGDGLTSLQYRPSAGNDTKEVRSDLKMPTRLRIDRHGNQFTMSARSGDDWKSSGPITVEMRDPIYVGLAVTAHNAHVRETVVFSNVKLEPGSQQASAGFQLVAQHFPFNF